MLNFNLLPWREQQRQALKKLVFKVSCIAGSVSLCIAILASVFVYQALSKEMVFSKQIKQKLTKIESELIQQIALKKQLQKEYSRYQAYTGMMQLPFSLLKLISVGLAETSYLEKISMDGQQITLMGYAQTMNSVASLLKTLSQSVLLQDIHLQQLMKKQSVYQFAIDMSHENKSQIK